VLRQDEPFTFPSVDDPRITLVVAVYHPSRDGPEQECQHIVLDREERRAGAPEAPALLHLHHHPPRVLGQDDAAHDRPGDDDSQAHDIVEVGPVHRHHHDSSHHDEHEQAFEHGALRDHPVSAIFHLKNLPTRS